ncbi:galactose-specific lectin nattectin-like [Megalobrama amblycephala]|uniref:galactose-specific lectin nattectin-like n=1 Tax=Megalobrama amblycephala TaxID=75352 RepID=UPI002014517A|nr:galactose-specific lectin nattectin-like [Megalobrama amblycephala]
MAMLRSFLLLFVIFSMGNAAVRPSCPFGWTNFGYRCYKHISQMADWIRAERNCQSLGANLASVRNKLENNFLLSLLPSSATRCWVGAHEGVQGGEWMWTDGAAFLYTNWCPGEPNNSQQPETCLELNFPNGRCWNDAPCSISKSYFCAKKAFG